MVDRRHGQSPLQDAYRADTVDIATDAASAVVLCERQNLNLLHVAGPDDVAFYRILEEHLGLTLPMQANTTTKGEHRTVLWVGPSQWLIVSTGSIPKAIETALRGIETPASVAVTDLSHGRSVIRIRGSAAGDVLAKGCGLDLHPSAFTSGDCAQTNLAGIGVLLHAHGNEPHFDLPEFDLLVFDLYIPRSYALSAWEWLIDAAAEFGCRVAVPEP